MAAGTSGMIALGMVATALAVRAGTRHRARAFLAAERARPRGAGGVFAGAEPIHLPGTSERAILLFHGFNDTPQSLAHLAQRLNARGWTVRVPLLPQHGRGSETMIDAGAAADWLAAALGEWKDFSVRYPNAIIGGQSMGGAIALTVAAELPPAALVLLAPYLRMGTLPRLLSRAWPLWQFFVPELRSDPERAYHDAEARGRALGGARFTPRLVAELRRVVEGAQRAILAVDAPTLVVHASRDYRIETTAAVAAYELLRTRDKSLVWIDRGGHVVAADAGRDMVAASVVAWLEQHAPVSAGGAAVHSNS